MPARLSVISLLPVLLIPAFLVAGQTGGSSNEAALIQTEIEAGAFAEALTQFCSGNNRAASARNEQQLNAWAQRNHWTTIQARLQADSALQGQFASRKGAIAAEFNAHRFKTAFTCGFLPQQLSSPAHDPSIQYGPQLQALSGIPAANANLTASPSAAPEPQPGPPAGATPDTAPAGQPAAGPITAGPVTFTPPSGWRLVKNTAEMAYLQTNSRHTKAVILIELLPLTGDLRTAFANTIHTQVPVNGLQMRYPHEGVTSNGSSMIQILDGGTLRGSQQRTDIDAVAVALGTRMLFAVEMSDDWGGESVGYRRVFEKMVAGWTLSGEQGPVWKPLHPPTPVGARQSFYFGARVQNQLNPLGGMDLRAVREYLVLLPTGQAFRAMPLGGHVLDMNFAAECTRLPNACGTYRIEGNEIEFTWRGEYGMVTRENLPFTPGGPGVSNVAGFEGTRAFEVAPVRHLRVSGRYTSTFAQTGSMGGQSTSVVAQTFINFQPDGSYQKSGFSAASFSGSGAGGTAQNQRGVESGRYSIDDYTLTLTPASGAAPEVFTTVFEQMSTSPKAIFIDDKAFLREGTR